MPGSPLVISRLAERDLASLFDWLSETAGPQTADSAIRKIEQVLKMLATSPGVGRRREDLHGAPQTFSVRPWVVFYEPLADRPGVVILRIIDGRRDLQNI